MSRESSGWDKNSGQGKARAVVTCAPRDDRGCPPRWARPPRHSCPTSGWGGASSAVSSYLEGLALGKSPRIWCPCQTEEGSASVNRGQGDWPLGTSTELSSGAYVSLPLGGTWGLST